MAKELKINPRIVEQLAKATVKNLPEGIVELVTNSDDSYKRLEDNGPKVKGIIEIYVDRKKGGICDNLIVKDYAEGMSKEALERAIEFGGETSGFEKGRSVRGLFGRGLKETTIALGEGEIKTVENGRLHKTKLWYDKKIRKPQYDDELLEKTEFTSEKNGTEINIKITNEKIKIPEYEKFKEQVSRHYALRDINSSENREVCLIFGDMKRSSTNTVRVNFEYPQGEKIIDNEEISLTSATDCLRLTIYESPIPLDSPRYNPFGLGGILIKTKGAILDNKLFRFENEPAAFYFFGEAICEGLEQRLREGEIEIIDFNRGGLQWDHEYCQTLSVGIEKILEPLILEKKKQLERKPEKAIKDSAKKLLKKLCSLLNELANQEFEELEGPVEPTPDIESLVIKPEVANIQIDKPRIFSIYAPEAIIKSEGQKAHIRSDNSDIQPLASEVQLERHKKYPLIWYRYFKVVGKKEDEECFIEIKLGKETARAKVKVAPPGKRRKGLIVERKGGFISDIIPDELSDPPQRVVYSNGIIKIYIKFPSVLKFIKSGLEGAETPEGKIMLAELVGEAFCKQLAMHGIEIGKYLKVPGGEIDSFNTAINELQKKYLHKVHEVIFNWDFEK